MNALHVNEAIAWMERAKYDSIWEFDEYKQYSPGLINVDRFLRVMQPEAGQGLIDIGCGEGIAGLKLQEHGLHVTWLDITGTALRPEVDRTRFIEASMWDAKWPMRNRLWWDYGFCCDVLEHIPTEFTMLAIDRVLSCCRTAWFQISLQPDEFGRLIGQALHLTVQPFTWWLARISAVGSVVDARDLCSDGLFVVERR